MADTTLSPNMNLVIPTVSLDPGPDWANNLNASLSILDQHTHASGSGVQITPAGISISTDLSFQSNNATLLRSTRYVSQNSVLVTASDLSCAYSVGDDGDLYWNDGLGNNIQITANGGVAGSPGSISNLTSPASASWVSGTSTFVWKATALLSANMDAATLIVRYPGSYPTPSGNYIAIQAPSSLASGYALTLPALPVGTSFMTLSNTGSIAATISTVQGITKAMLAPLGQQVSSAIDFTSSSGSNVDITNATVTITTSGRPVNVFLQPQGGGSDPARLSVSSSDTVFDVILVRDVTTVAAWRSGSAGINAAPSLVTYLDAPTAGTYTYKLQAAVTAGAGSFSFKFVKLVAYEVG